MTSFALINLCGFPTNAKLKTTELLQSDQFIYEMLKFKLAFLEISALASTHTY